MAGFIRQVIEKTYYRKLTGVELVFIAPQTEKHTSRKCLANPDLCSGK